ncbi:MAG: hypothetical protein LUC30_01330 [Clostridiales bacterium]|nr:hypothetical protein [Clostridiales bacterium]
MSAQTVKEIRAKFTADLSDYRKKVQEAGRVSQSFQDEITRIQQTMRTTRNVTDTEMKKVSSALSAAGKRAEQLGRQTKSLLSDESELTRAVEEQEGALDRMEGEYTDLQGTAGRLSDIFDQVQAATKGLDLSTPLQAQISAAEADIDRYAGEIERLQQLMEQSKAGHNSMLQMDDGSIVTLQEANQRLQEMISLSDQAAARYERLSQAAQAVGADNMQYASTAGLKQLQTEIGNANSKMESLGVKAGQTSSRLLTYQQRLDEVRSRQQQTATATDSLGQQIRKLGAQASGSGLSGFSSVLSGLGDRVRNLGSIALDAAKSGLANLWDKIKSIGSSSKSSRSGLEGMVKSIRNIGVVSLGLNVAKSLFGQLRSIVSSYVSENEALSDTVTQLKNGLGNALAPAINLVINAVSKLLPYIISISDAIASLITNLFGTGWTTVSTGASSASDAVDSVTDSTNAATAAQEEYNRTVAGFDQITKLDDNSSSGSSGGSGGGATTSTTDSTSGIAAAALSWLDDLTAALSDMWDVCKDAWDNVGSVVMESAQAAWDAVKSVVLDVGSTIYDVWTDGTGQTYVESLLLWFGSLLDIVASLAGTFDEAWNHAGQGESVISSLLTAATNVNNMLTSIGTAFANVWNNGTGTEVWSNLLNIITDVNNIVGNLASSFTKAWNEGERGEGIIQALIDPINTVLGYIQKATSATAEWADNLDFGPLLTAIKGVLSAIDPIIDTIGDVLETIWENVILPLGSWLTEVGLPDLLAGVQGFLETISEDLTMLWDYVILPLFTWLEDIGVFQAVYDVFMDLWDAVGGFFTGIFDSAQTLYKVFETISAFIQTLSSVSLWDILTGSDAWDEAWSSFELEVSAIWADDDETSEVVDTVTGGDQSIDVSVNSKMGSVWSSSAYGMLMETEDKSLMVTANSKMGSQWSSSAYKAATASDIIATTTENIKMGSTWSSSAYKAATATNKSATTTENIKKGSTWSSEAYGVLSSATAKTVTISATIGKKLTLKQLVDTSKTLQLKIAANGSTITGATMSVAARGGIVSAATLFGGNLLAGEAGAEAIVPLENHTEWLDMVADRLKESTQSGGNGQPVQIIVYVGGDRLVDKVVDGVNAITTRTGNCPIYV